MDSVEPQAHGVRQCGTKSMIFAECHQLPESRAGVAEPRNVSSDCTARGRLLSKIFLDDVVPMNAIFLRQFEIDVGGSLVERDIGKRAAGE